jgi:hypothetical protein
MHLPGILTRGSYYLTITFAPLFAIAHAAFWLRNGADSGTAVLFAIAVPYCFAAFRAWSRLWRKTELLPTAAIRQAPVISSLLFVANILGTLACAVTTSVLIDPRLPTTDDVGGPLLMFVFLTLVLYALALITAEWVLMGLSFEHARPGNRARPR